MSKSKNTHTHSARQTQSELTHFTKNMSSNKKKNNLLSQSKSFQSKSLTLTLSTDDDDDFQNPNPTPTPTPTQSIRSSLKPHTKISTSQPLKLSNNVPRFKKPKLSISTGKVNVAESSSVAAIDLDSFDDVVCSQFDSNTNTVTDENYVFSSIGLQTPEPAFDSSYKSDDDDCLTEKSECKSKKRYVSNSIESRLLAARMYDNLDDVGFDEASYVDFEPGTQLDDLIKLCEDGGEDDFPDGNGSVDGLVECPLCGSDISSLSEELRHAHTNDCLDKDEVQKTDPPGDDNRPKSPQRGTDISPVLDWLRGLGLSKYEDAFVKEEVDWDTLQWLTEEDLFSIGVTTLGPRKKMIHALNELRKGNAHADHGYAGSSKVSSDETKRIPGNKLITEFFPGSSVERNRNHTNQNKDNNRNGPNSVVAHGSENKFRGSAGKKETSRNYMRKGKSKDIPLWCCIPGTPFRVDAFRCLRGDCSHWFLTHFHTDHYQGLTRSFCHGKVYCSLITARLVNMKIGIPWDKLEILPLNQKVSIAGINVTCLDANHCPGAIIILFEPPNGKAVLHTGDFRFREEMVKIPTLQSCAVQTLILDTTYCNPQYDFPKQEAIIQFVIEAIQAEAFNPKTLFLIGSYTIGKERLFLEVARCLQKKVYVGAAKMHTIRCLELPEEDMKWFTSNEQESHIHVVPLWTIASCKRMKHISNQYLGRFSTIVAFSPTGWTYGKGKKKSQGRRWQQGTIIRYEVPYSEHSSFTELKEFVEFISPEKIIPSVNNDGPESVEAMIAMLKC